jgi:hypothetical protein
LILENPLQDAPFAGDGIIEQVFFFLEGLCGVTTIQI